MSIVIEVTPQSRCDTLVTAADGSGRSLHRTDHCGSIWWGDRPNIGKHGVVFKGRTTMAITSSIELPDSVSYRTGVPGVVVSASVSLQAINETAVVTLATASLRPLADDPTVAVVALELDGWVRTPLGISYQVVVLADPEALVSD